MFDGYQGGSFLPEPVECERLGQIDTPSHRTVIQLVLVVHAAREQL